MPDFEFEFNQKDKDLVISQEASNFVGANYIRLTIYPQEAINNIVTLSDSTRGIDGKAIFFSSTVSSLPVNISPFRNSVGVLNDINGIRQIGTNGGNDFKIYAPNTNAIYIKPNDIFNEFELPQGDYRIQIDFLKQELSDTPFVIKQISTSRKEVRLKIIDSQLNSNNSAISNIKDLLNTDKDDVVQDKYQFQHVLNIGTGDHNPIMNYQFDNITDGSDNQSIILKLYEPLPTNVRNLSMVTIEREVLTTQIQDIFYFSDVPDVFFGDGLLPSFQENWITPDGNNIQFENFDEISGSINSIVLDNLISSSEYNYPNLNTDFSEFANHTFFGSAKKKLENFNTKVTTIQGYYSDISESLYSEGVGISGDSSFVIQKRKNLFKKVNDEIKTFTPYERFLYYNGQQESTASAPGLGKNYADSTPVRLEVTEGTQLNGHDGFDVVYKHSTENMTDANVRVDIFNGKNLIQDKPFFNYSGSIYLSFLVKGDEFITSSRGGDLGGAGFRWDNVQQLNQNGLQGVPLPVNSLHQKLVQNPDITGSEYKRFIYEASMSYWVPTNVNNDDGIPINFDISNITDFDGTSTHYEIISGSIKTGSFKINDSTAKYPTTVISSSGVYFSGSCMPAGDPFFVRWANTGGGTTSSFITNVNVTLNNPTNVLPFDNVYKTTSTEWTSWYNGMIDSASAFDTDNIHSFENNLPLYLQTDSGSKEMRDFLNLQGEQYDLIRNHIDSLGTLHDRGYKKTDSPPDNTLPMLLSNMGWDAINPFSGSLTETLGTYLSGVTSIDDIKNATWRKTLNNLLYIYKSKGTKNSVRALLNTYGYPPDVLEFQEFGGSTEESNPRIFVNNPPNDTGIDLSLDTTTGSFSFTTKKEKLHRYIFGSNSNRILNLDWWMDDANLNTIEFVYKHSNTTQTQTILESSGSGTETLWDLRLVPSTDGASSSFEFRLNNSLTGSLAIASNALSMSTDYSNITDGQLWNIMLQRITGSTSTNIVQEYRLHSSLQNRNTIETYNYVTMSVSGAAATDSNNIANQNFMGTGSRHPLSSSNLFVGEIHSGSLSQIRGWSTALSTSKFRQHTLNKFSTVGNTINSYKNELIYHFKLNENYNSSSISSSTQNINIIDSSPTTTFLDYSFEADGNLFNTSSVYGFDFIDTVKLTMQDNISKPNDNGIVINPKRNIVGNLSPIQSATKPLEFANSKPLFKTSTKLELYRSPQTFVDNFILDNLSGFNLETLYGKPSNYYSQSYDEFNTFRENFFDAYPIEVDTNKFIRAHENMFNQSIIEGLKSVVPARSTFGDRNSNFGVEIKPTILEKQKYENELYSIETNPNTTTGSLSVVSVESIVSSSKIETPKSGSISVIAHELVVSSSKIEFPYSASIGRGYSPGELSSDASSSISPSLTGSSIVLPQSCSISKLPSTAGSTVVLPNSGTIDYSAHSNKSFENIHDNWATSSEATHFLNYAANTGSYGNYNVGHIDTRNVFHMIGDTEIYSGSRAANDTSSFNYTDFSNSSRFFNRTMITNDFHANVTYDSLDFATGSGIVAGRMMGKTRYFTTDSNGEMVFPSNHIVRYANQFKNQAYQGTQNVNPGTLNVRYEDYSTASFYRVDVTGGENQIRVQSGPTGIDNNNKIIYG